MAASSISSSSIRCSWVGGTSGWTTYTSRCRQFAWSCACRQSLLNRLISTGDSRTPSEAQIADARRRWALPLKTTISRTGGSLGRPRRVLASLTRGPAPRHGSWRGVRRVSRSSQPSGRDFSMRWSGLVLGWPWAGHGADHGMVSAQLLREGGGRCAHGGGSGACCSWCCRRWPSPHALQGQPHDGPSHRPRPGTGPRR